MSIDPLWILAWCTVIAGAYLIRQFMKGGP